MLRTRIGLDENGRFHRNIFRNPVHQRFPGKTHVLGHPAVHVVLEPVDVVLLAHPVPPGPAEAAHPARHDLIRRHPVVELEIALHPRAHLDDMADELMTGNDRSLDVRRTAFLPPEAGRPEERLRISRANPARLDLDDDLALSGARRVDLFVPVVLWCIRNKRFHSLRQISHPIQLPSRCFPEFRTMPESWPQFRYRKYASSPHGISDESDRPSCTSGRLRS